VPGLAALRRVTRWGGAAGVGLLLVLVIGGVAFAHGGRRLVVEPPVAAPGGTLSVHGSVLWSDQPVTVVLLAIDGTMWSLGDTVTSGNGDLEASVALPEGLPDATYSILARADNGEDAHVELVVRSPFPIGVVIGAGVAVIGVVLFVAAVVLRRRVASSAG
jgi:hypothetical protein